MLLIIFNQSSGGVIPPPNAPSGLVAVAVSDSRINLTWVSGGGGETGFSIERSLDGVSFVQIATVGAGVINYQDTNLAQQTTYYYRVRAFNGSGNSPYSNIASATTKASGIPPLMTTAGGGGSGGSSRKWGWFAKRKPRPRSRIEEELRRMKKQAAEDSRYQRERARREYLEDKIAVAEAELAQHRRRRFARVLGVLVSQGLV